MLVGILDREVIDERTSLVFEHRRKTLLPPIR
jgi:hypothetical protein